MMKLWYIIKKKLPHATIDVKNCSYCFNSVAALKNLAKDEVLLIVPDVNAFGIITKYHIGRTLRKHVKGTKLVQDLEKK